MYVGGDHKKILIDLKPSSMGARKHLPTCPVRRADNALCLFVQLVPAPGPPETCCLCEAMVRRCLLESETSPLNWFKWLQIFLCINLFYCRVLCFVFCFF